MKIRYYQTPGGRSPVEDFLPGLPEATRLEVAEGDMIMAWKEVSVEELAKSLGANVAEVREKQRLVKLIVKTRKEKDLSQAAIAKKLGISQARVAQIESGVGTAKVTFDVLFNMLVALGLDYKVVTRKAA